MLTTALTHPVLIDALARAGHGGKVLIADGNYPFSTAIGPNATVVYLNVAPGLLTVDQALETIFTATNFEAAVTMQTPTGEPAPPSQGYARVLGPRVEMSTTDRWGFYELARGEELAVLIATGDERPFANLLLTVGMR